jgi:hypothetical protein
MKPGDRECSDPKGRELVSIDIDIKPIPRHDLALIVTGICTRCGDYDEERIHEYMANPPKPFRRQPKDES